MPDLSEQMADRHSRMLAELAELTLGAARVLQGRLVAAETAAEARDLGLAFQRVSRSLRQTLMLEARLEKDRHAMAREDAAAAVEAREVLVTERKAKVYLSVGRAVLDAFETAEAAEPLMGELELYLDEYVRGHDFETSSLDELIAIFCRDLGVTPLTNSPAPAIEPIPDSDPPPSCAPELVQDGDWAPAPDSS